MIESQITWVYTHNLETTCRFYDTLLGLELARDAGKARIYKTSENAFIGVCTTFDNRAVNPAGSMISLITDDVDGWYETLRSAGVSLQGPPHKIAEFNIYTFFANDPNGYVIEFQEFLTA